MPANTLQHPVSLKDIENAKKLLEGRIRRSRVIDISENPSIKNHVGGSVFIKMENEQLTGSFKIRGALNRMLALSDSEKAKGVVASSAGNHAQGVAFGAQLIGAKAHIVMPETAPIVKINATKSYGANVILHGEVYDDAYAHARELEKNQGLTFVHPYLDPLVVAGQGTIGLELLEQVQNLETVIVPIGGGGLISGIATAIKAINPKVKVIGVVSEQAPGVARLFHGQKVLPPTKRIATIAEGIAVKNPSEEMFQKYLKPLLTDVVEVSDNEIALALVELLERQKAVVEGSGAAGLAALMAGKLKKHIGSGATAVLMCGGNIDLNVMSRVIESGLRAKHRLARIALIVDDLPGNLNRITALFAQERANILEVLHDRVSPLLGLRETRIDLLVETTNAEQISRINQKLREQGFKLMQVQESTTTL